MLFRITRYLSISVLAVSITLACFSLMQYLLHQPGTVTVDSVTDRVIVFENPDIPDFQPPPPRPPKPEYEPPPDIQPPDTDIPAQSQNLLAELIQSDLPQGLDGSVPALQGTTDLRQNSWGDGQLVKIVDIAPPYPVPAAIAGIEGWVKVQFTVTASGFVADVSVLDSRPRNVFDDAAVAAVSKWRFKPRHIDDQAVASQAIQVIEFNLDDG